ncbi:MAG: type II secretion system protein [Chthoniobacterales bacterium]
MNWLNIYNSVYLKNCSARACPRGKRAFLAEILGVIAVGALLAASAVPEFLSARKRAQEAPQILNDLRMIDAAVTDLRSRPTGKANP